MLMDMPVAGIEKKNEEDIRKCLWKGSDWRATSHNDNCGYRVEWT
jgi:hypothetical protein